MSYSESVLKTASIDVCFNTFNQISFFDENFNYRFKWKSEKYQSHWNRPNYTSIDAVFSADSEYDILKI